MNSGRGAKRGVDTGAGPLRQAEDLCAPAVPQHRYTLRRERLPMPKTYANYANYANASKLSPGDSRFKALPPLPQTVNLRPKFPPVTDQLDVGSCTGQALSAICAFLEQGPALSVLFLYFNERMLDHSEGEDQGSTLSCGMKALETYGICKDELWPYDTTKWKVRPSQACYIEALNRLAAKASQVEQNVDSMRACLASGKPIALGIQIYKSFELQEVTKTGMVRMPLPREFCFGGHAVVCVGYDDKRRLFIMRNSWGPGWGEGGYFYLPYDYLTTDDRLASDLWTFDFGRPAAPTPSARVAEAPPRLKASEPPAERPGASLLSAITFVRGTRALLCDVPPPSKPITLELAAKASSAGSTCVSKPNPQSAGAIASRLIGELCEPATPRNPDGSFGAIVLRDKRAWTSREALLEELNALLSKAGLLAHLAGVEQSVLPESEILALRLRAAS